MLMINEKAIKITAPAIGDQPLTTFDEIFDSEEDFSNLLRQLNIHKKVEDFEFRLKGTDRWVMVSCRYFQKEEFVEGVMVDVTDIKRNNQELHRLHYELDQFIYHASHELRSPLASMLGIVNLIEMDKREDVIPGHTQILKQKINHLDDLLKNIVAIAFNNKSKVIEDNIVWNNFLSSLLKEFDLVNSKVEVTYEVHQHSPFVSDIARLRIIIRNLISNSLRYHNPGVEKSWSKINVEVTETGTLLKIEDNGTGISAGYQKEIFKMFYKANIQGKGHGLGLYIVKIMVEKLGGKIDLQSIPNKGTTFTIYIPNLEEIR
jgi:signal transduction histidine kinase